MAHTIDTDAAALALAREIQRQGRAKPAVVVTIAAGQNTPYVDVENVEFEIGGLCDVYVMITGSPSWEFSNELPPGREVFGGASRVYGSDLEWLRDRSRSPLRFAYGRADGPRATTQLIEDALAAVYAGQRSLVPVKMAATVPRSGVVKGVVNGRALVDVGGRMPATVGPELVAPGIDADRMFRKKQSVSGLLDLAANRLDVVDSRSTPQRAFAEVGVGQAILARFAVDATLGGCLEILPGVLLPIDPAVFGAATSAELRSLMTPGEVLPVAVDEVESGVPSRLSPLPLDFVEEAVSVAIFEGGPTWLVPTPATVTVTDEIEVDEPSEEAPSESEALLREIAARDREIKRLSNELSQARTSTGTALQKLKDAERDAERARSGRARTSENIFADPFEQFRHEVYVSWAERTTAADKTEHRGGDSRSRARPERGDG